MSDTKLGVYKAIVAVQAALAKEGISKARTCTQGASYKFRGIDDVYNALAPFLAEANLCVLPRMLSRECIERQSKQGGALFYTTVTAEFDFVSAVDGSKHTVGPMYGEAMDSGDKGTNKAMSAAYKYAAFQAFCIPTEGDNDAENQTHEVKPQQQRQQRQQKTAEQPPKGNQPTPQSQPKEMATQEQLAKISDLILAIHNRDGGETADILKTISLFPGTNGDIWLTPDTLEKKCTKGYAGKIIGKAEAMLK